MRVGLLLLQLVRNGVRVIEWATGRRHYPWTSSPPQRLFARIAHRARGWPGAQYRLIYTIAAGALKYRERLHADGINLGLRVSAPVTARALAQAVVWQRDALELRSSESKQHVSVRVESPEVQLDRLTSLLLTSDALGTINFFFDEEAADDARYYALTLAEEKRGLCHEDVTRPDGVRLDTTASLESSLWSNVFSNRTGFDRNVNQYLKTAHPGATVVALSLPEDEAGFCDHSLPAWREAVAEYTADKPGVRFVVLNRAVAAALQPVAAAPRDGIAFASRAGLSTAEAVFLAQKADAYVGPLDVFGLAAQASRRPGIYIDGTATGSWAGAVIHTAAVSPRDALSRLDEVLPRHTPVAPRSPPQRYWTVHEPQAVPPATPRRADASPTAFSLERGSKPSPAPKPLEWSGADYTLVVPTYNRTEMLRRLLEFLRRSGAPFQVLVLDSSDAANQARNIECIGAYANVRHVPFPETTDPYVKMRAGLAIVDTPYCSLCADDDLIVLPTVHRCVQTLERERSAAVAHGYYFNFGCGATFDLSYIVYRGESVRSESALERFRMLFARYEAVIYGVYRTGVAQRMFRDIDQLDTVLARELLTGTLTALAGDCIRVPSFYYGRNTAESLSYSAWHPHQILATAPARLFSTYPAFRSLALEALTASGTTGAAASDPARAANAIDLIMLRYLQPYLRDDILDAILADTLKGRAPGEIVRHIWVDFVKATRSPRRTEPLIDSSGEYTPERFGGSRPLDYRCERRAWDGSRRDYRVFYEFLYPELGPPAAADKGQLLALLEALDLY